MTIREALTRSINTIAFQTFKKMGSETALSYLDKMKFKLSKAKYKDAVTSVEIRKVDSTRINMGRQIVNDFRQVMKRKPE